ncbi:MAG: gamma carbonic anhydrase family protein [Terriglobia bacterium]|jgi:carbonic anhydrase/acetyltransferase-like protein (isoleucine patch superfamily)
MILTLAGRTPRIAGSVYIAPSADVIGSVDLGENSSVWFQCVLRGDIEPIRVGANSNIQDGSIVHTMIGAPVVVGDWVTVGHRVVLHGCTVEDNCLIGMGAVLLNHVHVGEGSIVAAGSVVAEKTVIPPHSLYMGVPAKLRRVLRENEQPFIRMHATHYLDYKERYLAKEAQAVAAAFGEPGAKLQK